MSFLARLMYRTLAWKERQRAQRAASLKPEGGGQSEIPDLGVRGETLGSVLIWTFCCFATAFFSFFATSVKAEMGRAILVDSANQEDVISTILPEAVDIVNAHVQRSWDSSPSLEEGLEIIPKKNFVVHRPALIRRNGVAFRLGICKGNACLPANSPVLKIHSTDRQRQACRVCNFKVKGQAQAVFLFLERDLPISRRYPLAEACLLHFGLLFENTYLRAELEEHKKSHNQVSKSRTGNDPISNDQKCQPVPIHLVLLSFFSLLSGLAMMLLGGCYYVDVQCGCQTKNTKLFYLCIAAQIIGALLICTAFLIPLLVEISGKYCNT